MLQRKVFRIGDLRKDGKARMLKVICDNDQTKRMLIKGQEKLRKRIWDLKDSGFFIRDDMTDRQRFEDRKLRDELEQLRGIHKDNKFLVIRDGKIVEKRGKEILPFSE